jgi:flagellin-like protein
MHTPRSASNDDRGVSAVIGVILMVAITVAIAATVYVWVGGFDTGDGQTEAASATAQATSLDDDPKGEWIKITLTDGDGPYTADEVSVDIAEGTSSHSAVCDAPNSGSENSTQCNDDFSNQDEWEIGSSKWFPCQSDQRHSVSLALRDTTVLDKSVECQQAA